VYTGKRIGPIGFKTEKSSRKRKKEDAGDEENASAGARGENWPQISFKKGLSHEKPGRKRRRGG